MRLNKIIRTLIVSDIAIFSAWGLVVPILAIFITDQIQGGDVRVAGTAAAVYWILKSLMQVPVGLYLDKHKGEKDDFYFMFFGLLIAASTPFLFLFASLPWHIYAVQVVHAIGMGLVIPSWSAIFTRHIDKGKEAFNWSVESTGLGLGVGIGGAVGGYVASIFGFNVVFTIAGVIGVIGALIPLAIYKYFTPSADGLMGSYQKIDHIK